MYRISPIRALLGGLAAGFVASFAQNLFFKSTARIAPGQPEGAFTPPEPEQRSETATATVARRVAQGLMARDLSDEAKGRAAMAVHFGWGSMWGGLYGILGESFPSLRSPIGMVAYSTAVWGVSDNVILPAFHLSAWPQAYPPRNHAYAWAAHIAYGAALWGSYEAIQRVPWSTALQVIVLRRLYARARDRIGDLLREPVAAIAPIVKKPIERIVDQIGG